MGLANKIPVPSGVSAEASSRVSPLGVYVHVPFCSHACDFCAFYQIEPRRQDIDRYFAAIERELAMVPREPCATAFWGGGTPGLLAARDLERLGRLQIERFGVPQQEWTVELAPGSVKADKLAVLRDLGVTRVSMGVQSFSPRLLETLGRRHSLEQIRAAWELINAAGFRSRNLDLIFAVPGQTIEDWRADLDAAVCAEPDHISTYCLTFEEDTAMFVRLSQGQVTIDPERERAFYEETWDRLAAAGYAQYEISNHARPGHACVHNLNTWRMHRWAGFGPSAASQEAAWRGTNPPDLDAWITLLDRGERAMFDRVDLSPAQIAEDSLIFGLRMNDGVDVAALAVRCGRAALDHFRLALDRLVADGLAEWSGDRIALTRAGRLVVDAIGAELVGSSSALA